MKLSAKQWCQIKAALANIKCPHCFSVKVDLTEEEGENAKCDDCGCKFEFNPVMASRDAM